MAIKESQMDEEDKVPLVQTLASFDDMSIEALEEHIEALKTEIARTESAIQNKQGAKSAADSFFK